MNAYLRAFCSCCAYLRPILELAGSTPSGFSHRVPRVSLSASLDIYNASGLSCLFSSWLMIAGKYVSRSEHSGVLLSLPRFFVLFLAAEGSVCFLPPSTRAKRGCLLICLFCTWCAAFCRLATFGRLNNSSRVLQYR